MPLMPACGGEIAITNEGELVLPAVIETKINMHMGTIAIDEELPQPPRADDANKAAHSLRSRVHRIMQHPAAAMPLKP